MAIFLGGKTASIGFNKYYIVILMLLISVISLFLLYNQIKGNVGAIPTFVGCNLLFTKIGLFVITLISSIILYIALKYYNKSTKFKEGGIKNEEY